MLTTIKNITRLTKIFTVLAKYDALFFVREIKAFPIAYRIAKLVSPKKYSKVKGLREGERLCLAFQELGPTFIKLGQALSVRSDIVGEEVSNDLSKLQDNLPPFDTEAAKEIIEKELGQTTEALYKTFNEIPVAAASIAQVHFATDFKGNKLAVKVLRPNVKQRFDKDLSLFYWIAQKVDSNLSKYKRLRLIETVDTFAKSTLIEMDFTFEAAAASKIRENFEGDEEIRVPLIYWDKTSEKVLTLERFEGVQINDISALKKAGLNPTDILKKSTNIFMKQTLRDGFFHADMHPGNVLVDKDGKLCIFDFGIVGRLDRKTKIFLAEMLLGFLQGDYEKVSDIHFEAGYIPKDQDRALFAQACRSIGEPIFDLPQSEISIARLLQKLFKVTEQFNMKTQPQLLLLQKTMMMAEGIGRKLNPDINFWELSRELIEDWGRENLGPKARVEDKFKDSMQAFNKLTDAALNLDKIITDKGFIIHPETINLLRGKRKYGFGHGVVFALISIGLVYSVALWLTS